ncbi:COPII coat assembly protein SEC16 [Thraustotheca clavata]|uniref:COPII coat assembly protein SEC16 n=1 Tax=Thraustotheca clavata TaxID=74557 RepID=A0A1V9ZY12_9STRA|nr:COPII coat assembly protein SEC16 [Thraustotheca clavata]
MFPKRKLKLNHYSRNSPRPQGYQTSFEEPVDDGDLRKGPIVFYTMDQVHPKDAFVQRIHAFPGPLSQPSTTDDAILKYLHTQVEQAVGDDKLLWELFEVFVKTRGRIATRDAQAPEILLMQLLQNAEARRHPTSYDVATLPFNPTPDQHQAAANQMRQLLLAGDRRAAIDVAKSSNLWPQAMLIASFVDPDIYKSVVHSFVTSQYVASDPMRSLFLLFGDLEEKCVQEPVALNAAAVATPTSSPLLTNWLAHVVMWIANPTKDTNTALLGLGDRLMKEANMVSAAHICYMLSGATLEAPSPASRLVLVGGNHNDARSFVRPTSIHLTEIVEHVLKPNQQIPFQGYKFIYASLLADLGMCDLAYKYVDSMRKQLDNWQQKQKLSPYLETVRMQVDVLEDRLKLHLGQDRAEAATVKESKGFFSALREKLDKSLDAIVNDTPVQAVPTQPHHAGPEFPQHLFPPAPGSGTRTPLQQAPGSGPGMYYGPNSGHHPNSMQAPPNSGHPNAMQAPGSGHPNTMQAPGSGHPNTMQAPGSGHPNSSHGLAPLHPQAPASNGAPKTSNYGPGSNSGMSPSLPPRVPQAETSHAPLHRSHSFTQESKPNEPTQIKRAATTDEVPKHQEPSPSKEKAKAKTPPPSNTGSSRGWRWLPNLGIKDYLTSKLEPTGDAKVAKLGDKMEAYYDEKLKRWVFPKGEGEEEVEELPSAPPTSFPAATHSAPASQATDDPLAALMAPPSRNTGPASQDGNALSSMIAPPARSNLYGSQRGSQRTLNRKPSRPQYAVFKPSPSTATEDVPPSESS